MPRPGGLTFVAGFAILELDKANYRRPSTPDRPAGISGRTPEETGKGARDVLG